MVLVCLNPHRLIHLIGIDLGTSHKDWFVTRKTTVARLAQQDLASPCHNGARELVRALDKPSWNFLSPTTLH